MKRAFYPCCASDIEEPRTLLRNYADEIIFCDLSPRLSHWAKRIDGMESDLPVAKFVVGDVRAVLPNLPAISVLFYRRDSEGEGGSGLFTLGGSILPLILERFPAEGGLIVTDGSNSRGGNFRKMIRQNGLSKHGWNFAKLTDQPLLGSHGLWMISVTPVGNVLWSGIAPATVWKD
jgi:hypothetical protein